MERGGELSNRLDRDSGIFCWGGGVDPVSEIENMSWARSIVGQGLLDSLSDRFGRGSDESSRIEIALKSIAVAKEVSGVLQGDPPVDSQSGG